MTEVLTPDICVIGAGAGGLSVAAAAAAFGVPVVLIEKGKMGGECLNAGCVPSKALIAAAARARAHTGADAFGVTMLPPHVDFARVRDHVQGVIAAIAPNDSKARFTGLGVRVIEGEARFKSKDVVAVGDAIEIKARRVVIATGSSPVIPSIPGLDTTPYLTNETVFDLAACPEHLIILGGGPVGVELAQAFRRLGAAVTVLEANAPLGREDAECARIVLDQLTQEGVVLRGGVSVARVETQGQGVAVVLGGAADGERIAGSHLLIATGRRPHVDGLDLDAAGIAHTTPASPSIAGCAPAIAASMRSATLPAGSSFTHLANYHAGLVIRNALFRLPVKADDSLIPRVTFTDPELAHVGLSEDEARRAYKTIRVLRWPLSENDRAQTERATRGHIKVITDKRGRILGATIVGARCRRIDRAVGAGAVEPAQYPRRRRNRAALSDLGRGW